MVNIQAKKVEDWLTLRSPKTHVKPSRGKSTIVA